MSVYNDIRNEIVTKLETATNLSKVYRYPVADLEGYPAAVVRTADSEGRFHSTTKDEVVFSYSIFVYYPLPKEEGSSDQERENAELALGNAVSEIIFDIFKKRGELSNADWIAPVNSTFTEVTAGSRPYLSAEISLQAKVYVTNR